MRVYYFLIKRKRHFEQSDTMRGVKMILPKVGKCLVTRLNAGVSIVRYVEFPSIAFPVARRIGAYDSGTCFDSQ